MLPTVPHVRWSGLPFHIGVTTDDLGRTMDYLTDLLGVSWTAVISDPMTGLRGPDGPVDWQARRVHSIEGPLRLELFEGSAGSTWHTGARLTLHHVAFWSDDVAADTAELESQGWQREISWTDAGGRPAGFAYLVHPQEPRIELVESTRRPHYAALLAGVSG